MLKKILQTIVTAMLLTFITHPTFALCVKNQSGESVEFKLDYWWNAVWFSSQKVVNGDTVCTSDDDDSNIDVTVAALQHGPVGDDCTYKWTICDVDVNKKHGFITVVSAGKDSPNACQVSQ